jgi:hypothetical protein
MSKKPTKVLSKEEIVDKLYKSVKLEKVRITYVREALKTHKLESTGTAEEVVKRLLAHQVENREAVDSLLECDTCGAFSMETYDDCPFCRSEEGEADAAPEPEAKPVKAPKAAKEAKPAKAPKAEKAAKAPKVEPAKVEEKPVKPRKRIMKPTATEDVGDGSHAVVMDAKELDAEVAAIKEAQDRGTASLFEVGHRMLRIRSNGLHSLRLNAAGKSLYKKWDEFCQAELGMTRVHAQRIMNVVDGFQADEVNEIGVDKLAIIVGVKSGESREHLLALARAGEPRSKIRDEVKRLTDAGKLERGSSDKAAPAREAARAANRKQAPEKSDQITLATTEQEVSIPLKDKDGNQAVKLTHGMKGEEITSNGIVITYTVNVVKGAGVFLEVTRKRAED